MQTVESKAFEIEFKKFLISNHIRYIGNRRYNNKFEIHSRNDVNLILLVFGDKFKQSSACDLRYHCQVW